jgi:hypothetical protein
MQRLSERKDRERDIGAAGRQFKLNQRIDFLCFWGTIVCTLIILWPAFSLIWMSNI